LGFNTGWDTIEPRQLVYWDAFLAFTIVFYTCFYDTYMTAFDYSRDGRALTWATTAFYAFDVALLCVTAYEADGYFLIVERRAVIERYLATWFLADVVTSVPWDLVVVAATARSSTYRVETGWLQVLALTRVFRAARLPRLCAPAWVVARWRRVHSVKRGFLVYVFFFFCTAHFLGCLFFIAPRLASKDQREHGWLARYGRGYENTSKSRQWMLSFYWSVTTISTIGYGDIVPWLMPEMWVAIATEFVGTMAFALLVMHIQKLYEVYHDEAGLGGHANERDELSRYMDAMRVGVGLRRRVHKYLNYAARAHPYSSFDDEDPLFAPLSPKLRADLRLAVVCPILARVPAFARESRARVAAVAAVVDFVACSPGERIVGRGAYGDALVVVLTGRVAVVDGDGLVARTTSGADAGNVIGVCATLHDEAHDLVRALADDLTVDAVDYVSVATADRSSFRDFTLPRWPHADVALLEALAESAGVPRGALPRTAWLGHLPEGLGDAGAVREDVEAATGAAVLEASYYPASAAADQAEASGPFALVTFADPAAAKALGEAEAYRGSDGSLACPTRLDRDPVKALAVALFLALYEGPRDGDGDDDNDDEANALSPSALDALSAWASSFRSSSPPDSRPEMSSADSVRRLKSRKSSFRIKLRDESFKNLHTKKQSKSLGRRPSAAAKKFVAAALARPAPRRRSMSVPKQSDFLTTGHTL